MPKILEYFETAAVEYVLVGAAHLVGEDGLLQQLERSGFKVTPIAIAALTCIQGGDESAQEDQFGLAGIFDGLRFATAGNLKHSRSEWLLGSIIDNDAFT